MSHSRIAHTLPNPSGFLVRSFARYSKAYLARHFHSIRISRASAPVPDADCQAPIVVYFNHPSWWDPLVAITLTQRYFPTRAAFAPIDSAALQKYAFFKWLGFFGVEQDTHRGAASFLRISTEILARPRTVLWITPQGHFRDPRARPVRFKAGLAHLAAKLPEAHFIPLALEYPFWEERTPEVLIRFGPRFIPGIRCGSHELQRALERHLEQTMDALASESLSRDPARFEPLLAGRAGTGGIYQSWQRVRARIRGQEFHPEHSRP